MSSNEQNKDVTMTDATAVVAPHRIAVLSASSTSSSESSDVSSHAILFASAGSPSLCLLPLNGTSACIPLLEPASSSPVQEFTVSSSGRFVAALCADKSIYLWEVPSVSLCRIDEWKLLFTKHASKRGTNLCFTEDETHLMVSESAGDVTCWTTVAPYHSADLLLGHCAAATAICATHDNSHVITADRYGKIRVSEFPRGFNITAFCLGHEDFITDLLTPASHPQTLVSFSLDGTLRVWQFAEGVCTQTLTVQEQKNEKREEQEQEEEEDQATKGEDAEGDEEEEEDNVNSRCSSAVTEPVLAAYSSRLDLLAVSVRGTGRLDLYSIGEHSLELVQQLDTSMRSHVAACFDAQGGLWVSGRLSSSPSRSAATTATETLGGEVALRLFTRQQDAQEKREGACRFVPSTQLSAELSDRFQSSLPAVSSSEVRKLERLADRHCSLRFHTELDGSSSEHNRLGKEQSRKRAKPTRE